MPAHRLPDLPGRLAIPVEHVNAASDEDLHQILLSCLHSPRWSRRVAEHRPYPDLDSLLAAADEAAYDLTWADLTEALAAESLPALPPDTYSAAHTALSAAHAAYEARFGHVFVICLDGVAPAEVLDRLLEAVRSRLTNDPEEERAVTADELRRLARGRLLTALRGAGNCAINH
ncbi:2-oxo-4-hydroxy-4-carboxy-5-ureidoimidazoline decarboxylase [Streptomyces tuirus]|uniref:2-oxo-4-hydroxy-4-carboxy-5-ureidoimidazoline decarboxylase n=1 Tax=Streptomyces tuirus TaxID=68278 RepID=A0A941FHE9_9ACTN|nr:2-oxo-4-hydroxy-4-carboxy-5-ureidoimidazoline decarboxylase [Streptomyces tuirus]